MNEPDLQAVYRERVLTHSKQPLNFRRQENCDCEATGFNQLCGDKVSVYLTLENDTVTDASFEGAGCAISIASASMMTEALLGCTVTEAEQLLEQAATIFTADTAPTNPRLDNIKALEGVKQYPSRIKCATLAWQTLAAALQGNNETVTTE